ncbi:tyrosine-type recombinase/integrase [Alkalimarinus alittae]|uniref:Tyrosine-type recombinase/integrase n=1 Tax=Alkalimarinus alittae TaxID=2961619 RepID=A0ABY6MXG5_9ALTE|nr:tyrosine-type recombinase/integrase [Alkalimarinus alittae]UZE94527.1 tyrosine-type recombinase/integrase [Alkalimarinus alittae]
MKEIDSNPVSLASKNDLLLGEASSLPALEAKHQQYLQAATSDNTRKTYRSAIRHFERWGGRLPTDNETLIRYLVDHAESLNTRTLEVRLTALSQWHRFQGFNDPAQDPTVRKTLKGIGRTHGKPKKKAQALRLQDMVTMLTHLNQQAPSLKRTRDKALLLIAYFGGFRRSELVMIEAGHLSWEPEGLIIELPKSKTDQEGKGMLRAIPYGSKTVCPVTSLKEWLADSDISEGPVFRPVNRWGQLQPKAMSPGSINDLLKTIGKACNFDFVPDLSSHSLRRGLATTSARENVDFETIKKQGGWKSDATVWGYIDEGRLFTDNVTHTLIDRISELIGRQK